MHFTNSLLCLASLAAVNAQAGTTIQVSVGANGRLAYSPNNINASVGTQIEFSYNPKVCSPENDMNTVADVPAEPQCHSVEFWQPMPSSSWWWIFLRLCTNQTVSFLYNVHNHR
jgi:hypothetical protein